MKNLMIIGLLVLAQACLEPDVTVVPPLPHEFTTLHSLQSPHVFMDVNKKIVSHITPDSTWHLKFQNGSKDWAIFLNPLRDVSIHKSSFTDIEELLPSYVVQNELDWHRDVPVDNNVLPAIGTWGDYSFEFPKSFNNVYVLRIKNKQQIAYFKLQILAANNLNYTIQYSDLTGENSYYYVVPKDQRTTHSYLNLRPFPRVVDVEPHKNDWQLQFTFGLDSIANNTDQYLVRPLKMLGLYQKLNTNKKEVELYLETSIPFEEITYFDIKNKQFIRAEQLSMPFVEYDYAQHEVVLKNDVSLVCKMGSRYVKIAPEEFELISPSVFEVKMRIQNL